MKIELMPEILNSIGLVLDIIGAWFLYKYVFTKPPSLVEQYSHPGSAEKKMVDGVENMIITGGATLDLNAWAKNKYYEYKEVMYQKRAFTGVLYLTSGFFYQLLSNITHFVVLELIATFFITTLFILLFFTLYSGLYLSSIPEIPKNYGINSGIKDSENSSSLTMREEDKKWLTLLLDRLKRAGL